MNKNVVAQITTSEALLDNGGFVRALLRIGNMPVIMGSQGLDENSVVLEDDTSSEIIVGDWYHQELDGNRLRFWGHIAKENCGQSPSADFFDDCYTGRTELTRSNFRM